MSRTWIFNLLVTISDDMVEQGQEERMKYKKTSATIDSIVLFFVFFQRIDEGHDVHFHSSLDDMRHGNVLETPHWSVAVISKDDDYYFRRIIVYYLKMNYSIKNLTRSYYILQ